MVSLRLLGSFHCACALLVVQGLILISQIPATRASPSRHWLQSLDPDTETDLHSSSYKQRWRRDLQLMESIDDASDEDLGNDNCSKIEDPLPSSSNFNDTCQFVKERCEDKYELFNYLRFAVCDLGKAFGFIFLSLWLFYLLLLLSSTVDNFFVPVLQLLSDKLHLPPSVAGMTLLALGNGAPDIFVAFSALQDDDVALMLGALLGAGLFIVTVVLGTVLLVAPGRKSYNIHPFNFMRDLLAYLVVLAIIVAVAYDGKVTLAEAICFPLFYVLYVALVLSVTFFKKWWDRRKLEESEKHNVFFNKEEDDVTIEKSYSPKVPRADNSNSVTKSISKEDATDIEESVESDTEVGTEEKPNSKQEKPRSVIIPPAKEKKKLELAGLTIPKGIIRKVLYVLEFPFSVLRWLTIPPCSHDGQWSVIHFMFAVFSPVPMSLLLLLVATGGWSGFTRTVGNSKFPVAVLVVICASPLCVVLFFTLNRKRPPHWIMQIVLMIGAFVMSIAWLNVIANEVVSVLQALGLLVGITTAILGLTVLAIGNSVADWVADSLVSSKGRPEMGIASCFGAPLITHVLGLSVALLPKVFEKDADPYEVNIRTEGFVHVKLAWIFLGIALLGSAVIFPLLKFKPPKEYSLVLVYVYMVFMIFSVLTETKTFDIKLL